MNSSGQILSYAAVSCPLRLITPYNLSFGAMAHLDSFFVKILTQHGAGYGEITPLPGYSTETLQTVESALATISTYLEEGQEGTEIIARLNDEAPMVASAFACAIETSKIGVDAAFLKSQDAIPLLALCQGESPNAVASEAKRLSDEGYTTLKMKVGTRPVADDLALLSAAANGAALGTRIRIDANQAMTPESARALILVLEDLPIELFEQPFPPKMDEEMGLLAAASSVPLMLDESICGPGDIDRASALGVQYVKLKLCKHPGIAATLDMVAHAKAKGLQLVFGNGVQSALGNRLEARIHREGGIGTASEANGFLKVAKSPFAEAMTAREGQLIDDGLVDLKTPFATGKVLARWQKSNCSMQDRTL